LKHTTMTAVTAMLARISLAPRPNGSIAFTAIFLIEQKGKRWKRQEYDRDPKAGGAEQD
jgi:hypothetical protein